MKSSMNKSTLLIIAVVSVAIIYFAPISNAQEINERSIFGGILDLVIRLINQVITSVLGVINGILRTVGILVGEITRLISITLPNIINNLLGSIARAIASAASETIENALTAISELIQGQIETIFRLINSLAGREGAIQQAIAEIEGSIQNATKVILDLASRCAEKIPVQVVDIVRKSTTELTNCASGTIGVVTIELNLVRSAVLRTQLLVDQILTAITNCLSNSNETVTETCLNGLNGNITDALNDIVNILNINNTIGPGVENVKNCIQGVINVAESKLAC